MYRIAVLADREPERQALAGQIDRFCQERGLFPTISQYPSQEHFFASVPQAPPGKAVIALSGVSGLNAAEHLRSLAPAWGILWCSDLDFSLQAFRLKVDYFLRKPVAPEDLRQALLVWFDAY